MVGRKFLQAIVSIYFDVKTKWVVTEPQQLSTVVLTFFSKLVECLHIYGIFKYTGYFSGPNRLGAEN